MAPHYRPNGRPDLPQLEQLATTVETAAAEQTPDAPTSHEQLRCATSGASRAWTSEIAEDREMAAIECQACPKRLWCITSALEQGDDIFGVWGGLTETELSAERALGLTPHQILRRAQARERETLLTLAITATTRRASADAGAPGDAELIGVPREPQRRSTTSGAHLGTWSRTAGAA